MTFGSESCRKASPASNRIATPTESAAETISGGAALGRMIVQMMRALRAPMARSALTKSSSRRRRNSARTRRAVLVQETTPMAMEME